MIIDMMTKQELYVPKEKKSEYNANNFADTLMKPCIAMDKEGRPIRFGLIVGNEAINFYKGEQSLLEQITKIEKNGNSKQLEDLKQEFDFLKSKKAFCKNDFTKYFGKILRDHVGDFTLYDGHVAFKPEDWSGVNSKFNFGFKDGMLNVIILRLVFDISQFGFLKQSEDTATIFAKVLLEIKNMINNMTISHDMKKIFNNTNPLEIVVKINIAHPGVFFVTIDYPKDSLDQVTAYKKKESELYKKITTYMNNDTLLADISKDLQSGFAIFYNMKNERAEIIPVHVTLNYANSGPYIISFANWVSSSKSSHSHRGSTVRNFHPAIGDSAQYHEELSSKLKRSIVLKVNNVFNHPVYAFRKNMEGNWAIDEYMRVLTLLDVSSVDRNNLWQIRNDLIEKMSLIHGVYASNITKTIKTGSVIKHMGQISRGPLPISKLFQSGHIPKFDNKDDLYQKLLPGVNNYSCFLVVKNPYIKDDNIHNVLCILNNLYMPNVLVSYYHGERIKDQKILVADDLVENSSDSFMELTNCFSVITSRDPDVLPKMQEKRDKKLDQINGKNSESSKVETQYPMLFSDYVRDKKPMGNVVAIDLMSKFVIMHCERRIFFSLSMGVVDKKTDTIWPFIQDKDIYLVSFDDYPFIMVSDKDSIKSINMEDMFSRFNLKDYAYERAGFMLNPWKYNKEKKQSIIAPQIVHTFFLSLGVKGSRFYIEDFTTIRDLCRAFVEIFVEGNYEGKICKSFLKSGELKCEAQSKDTKEEFYYSCANKFVEHYMQVLSSNLSKIISDNIKEHVDTGFNAGIPFSLEHVNNVCLSLVQFVGSIVFGFTEQENVKNSELIEKLSEKYLKYTAIEKSFEILYNSIKHMFLMEEACMLYSAKNNVKLTDLVFHELKSHLMLSVLEHWVLVKKDDVLKNENHYDKEANSISHKYNDFNIGLLTHETGHGFVTVKYENEYTNTSGEYMSHILKMLHNLPNGHFYDPDLNTLMSVGLNKEKK